MSFCLMSIAIWNIHESFVVELRVEFQQCFSELEK